jgi:hypothetical protein
MDKNKFGPGVGTLSEGIKKLTSVPFSYFLIKFPEFHQCEALWLQTKNTISRILRYPFLKDYITRSNQPFRHGISPSEFSKTG